MTEQKHTPGPWRFTRVDIQVNKLGHYVETSGGRMDALWSDGTGNAVAVPAHPAQHGFGSFGLTEADAALVAAAPDLLEVAVIDHVLWSIGYTEQARRELIERGIDPPPREQLARWQQSRRPAVIAKATGGEKTP